MNKKNLIIALAIIIVFLVGFYIFSNKEVPNENNEIEQSEEVGESENMNEEESQETSGFINCLAQADLLVYGMEWCPACKQLVASLGGYETADSIYVECTQEEERCDNNLQTGYVPEIQINGQVYDGPRDPASLASEVGCQYDGE